MSGFYLMHRGWQENPVFRNEEYSKRDAFIWLIEEAAYLPTRVHAASGAINLKRGQLSHSLRFMAKAWKWDEAKVRRFLSSLVKSEIIDAATDAGQTVVTIRNYDKYQSPIATPDAANDADATQQRRGDDANKETREIRKEGNTLSSERERAPAPKPIPFPKPDWADPQVWSDFLANRKRKKLGSTVTAYKGFLEDIDRNTDEDWPPGRLLEVATRKGHGAIYPSIKETGNGLSRQSDPSPSLRGRRPDPALDLYRAACAAEEAEHSACGGPDSFGAWPAVSALERR